jgi:hypothetical protein
MFDYIPLRVYRLVRTYIRLNGETRLLHFSTPMDVIAFANNMRSITALGIRQATATKQQ